MPRRAPDEWDRIIGANIRKWRRARGITRDDLADCLAITYQQIQKYENGANRIAAGDLMALSTLLNCRLEYFFQKE